MKLASLSALTAAIGLGLSIADRSGGPTPNMTTSYPPGCAVAVGGEDRLLPRAGLMIENRRASPVRAWIEPRYGLPRADLGIVAAGESMFVAQTIPAGRNLLQATDLEGRVTRTVMQVANRGAGTCRRRYLWRIE
jgi:hypothetical protein